MTKDNQTRKETLEEQSTRKAKEAGASQNIPNSFEQIKQNFDQNPTIKSFDAIQKFYKTEYLRSHPDKSNGGEDAIFQKALDQKEKVLGEAAITLLKKNNSLLTIDSSDSSTLKLFRTIDNYLKYNQNSTFLTNELNKKISNIASNSLNKNLLDDELGTINITITQKLSEPIPINLIEEKEEATAALKKAEEHFKIAQQNLQKAQEELQEKKLPIEEFKKQKENDVEAAKKEKILKEEEIKKLYSEIKSDISSVNNTLAQEADLIAQQERQREYAAARRAQQERQREDAARRAQQERQREDADRRAQQERRRKEAELRRPEEESYYNDFDLRFQDTGGDYLQKRMEELKIGISNITLSIIDSINSNELDSKLRSLTKDTLNEALNTSIDVKVNSLFPPSSKQKSRTPLQLAITSKNASLNTIQTLLDYGSDPEAKNKKGQTALDFAKAKYGEEGAIYQAILDKKNSKTRSSDNDPYPDKPSERVFEARNEEIRSRGEVDLFL